MRLKEKFLLLLTRFFDMEYSLLGSPVIILNKNKILLGKRASNSPLYPGLWGLPGGLVEKGEQIETASKREVKEELGIKIKILKRSQNIFDQNIHFRKVSIRAINIPVYAKITQGVPKPKDETSDVRYFSPDEIKKIKLAYNHKEILKKEGLI
jgi:8-oxo-dGTP diphosphatase